MKVRNAGLLVRRPAKGDAMTTEIKLGCRLPINKPALQLGDFLTGVLPATPPVDYLARLTAWQMLGNDKYGDCVAVTWANVWRLVSAVLTGAEIYISQAEVLALYKTQNPLFDPRYPGVHDNGMDIQTLLEYLQKRGAIVAFAQVDRANHAQVDAAISIFGFVWTSLAVRDAAMADFNAGRPWSYHPTSPIRGYHSVISGGHRDVATDDIRFVTWARETGFSSDFWAHDVNGAWAVILPDHLKSKAFMDGIDLPALAAAFQTITGRVLTIPEAQMIPTLPFGSLTVTAAINVRGVDLNTGALVAGVAGKTFPVLFETTLATSISPDPDSAHVYAVAVGTQLVGILARNCTFTPANPVTTGHTFTTTRDDGLVVAKF
jgi:hypothetical protein